MPEDRPPTNPDASGSPGASSSDDDLISAAKLAAEARSDGRASEPDLPPPDYFPGYVVSREIHRGGQGIVYQAVHKTTKRKVAIKVMLEGVLASTRERTRFEREVEILAQLEHPGIVNVLDSGSVEGRFYYVMDYISGSTLDVWISQNDLSIAEVLELFGKVCEAVNAAHLQGVIHRDLKPANIRVDSNGRPHVVDFGLARIATGSFSDDQKLMTMTGQFIGSLPWASPEQAQGLPGMIDVRTDVYSLGVMLYQLLTGRFPYQVAGAMRDVLDNILRAEPERPSTVRRQINDEVETIVLKCLSKERERRYQNAGDLARDLGRYLSGDPIEAKRDSGWYVLKKTARRYRGFVAAAAVFLVLLAGFAVAMSVMYGQKSRALDDLTAETDARREIIAELEVWLESPNPTLGAGKDVTMRQVADEAARRLDERALADQPRVEATLRSIIGKTYFGLGEWPRAEPHLRRAAELQADLLGPDDPETIESNHMLGVVLRNLVRLDEAEPLLRETRRRAETVYGTSDERTFMAINDLGQLFKLKRDHEAAITQFREALSLAPKDLDARTLAVLRGNLGESLATTGRVDEALELLRECVDGLEAAHAGAPHPDVGRARVRLAALYQATAREDDARSELDRAVAAFDATLDRTHPDLLATKLRLAVALERADETDRAIAMFGAIVEAGEATLPPESPVLAWYRHLSGRSLLRVDRAAEARVLLEPAVAALRDANHPRTPEAMETLAACYDALDEADAASGLRQEIETLRGG